MKLSGKVPTFPSPELEPAPRYSAGKVSAIYIRAEDGTLLALDIVLPVPMPASGKVPAVLLMTRYWRGKVGEPANEVERNYASHGYAVVYGDVRGTGASFGIWPYQRSRAETNDFSAVMDWIIAQSWSDGRIVGVGKSYTANTADWMAEQNHPALKAIVPRFADYDPYEDLYFPGGVPNAFMSRTWGLWVKDLDRNILFDGKGAKTAGVRPVDEPGGENLLREAIVQRTHVPSVWDGMRDVVCRDDRPVTWNGASMEDWSIRSHAPAVCRSRTPIQTWASWMDAGTAHGAISRFILQSNPMQVFIGPWNHGGHAVFDPLVPNQRQIGPDFETQKLMDHRFIEECLGRDGPGASDRALYYYTLGNGGWKRTRTWPPRGIKWEDWYLSANRTLSPVPNGDGSDQYAVDFSVGSGKQNRWATNLASGEVFCGDRREIDSKLLVYDTPPLEFARELTGNISATLFLSSTHSDGCIFAYFEVVGPDGYVHYVTEGQFRFIHRKKLEDSALAQLGPQHSFRSEDLIPLVPGEVEEISFILHPISVLIPAGYRMRVALSGADCDTFARIPVRGDPTLKVHRSEGRRSRVHLPFFG